MMVLTLKKIIFSCVFIILYNIVFSQNIIKFANPILRTNDTLIVYGNGIYTLQYFNFPTTGFFANYINKQKDINSNDTIYTFIVPTQLTNKLYQIYGIDYNLKKTNSRLLRVYDFNVDSIGFTIWGANNFNQGFVPKSIEKIVYISGGNGTSFAIDYTGKIVGWGRNNEKQLNFPNNKKALAASGGGDNVLVLYEDGSVGCYGSNTYSKCNLPNINQNFVDIVAGSNYSALLTDSGKVIVIPSTGFYLGLMPNFSSKAIRISGGYTHILALLEDSTAISWDYDINSTNVTSVPRNLKKIKDISAGTDFNTVLYYDSTIFSWGDNSENQLNIPIGLNNVIEIANGSLHTLVLKSDNTLVAWGNNDNNQTEIPVGLTNVKSIKGVAFSQRNFIIHLISVVTKTNIGGTISPTVFLKNNTNYRVTYQALYGYKIDSIFINGIYNSVATKDSLNSYTFYAVIGIASINVKYRKLREYTIKTSVVFGTVSPMTTVFENGTFKIRYTPISKKYFIDSILLNDILLSKDSINSYTLNLINKNYNFKVVFYKKYDNDIITSVKNGIITPSIEAYDGKDYVVTYTENKGYILDSIYVNGRYNSIASKDSLKSYTIKNILDDSSIYVVFKIKQSKIFSEQNEGGTISQPKEILVDYFNVYNFIIKANIGYEIDKILINNIPINLDKNRAGTVLTEDGAFIEYRYIFSEVLIDQIFKIQFKKRLFKINTCVNIGLITPAIPDANYFNNYLITYQSDSIYTLDSIVVNGIKQSNDSLEGFTFSKTLENKEICVYYKPKEKDIYPADIISPKNIDDYFDYWKIINIEYYPENIIQIFNKYGTEVYNIENFKNEFKWKGIDKYGVPLLNGQYYYKITLERDGKILRIIKGVLTILN